MTLLKSAVPFDNETSTEVPHIGELHPKKRELFRKKYAKEIADSGDPSGNTTYFEKAPLTPHYGQIVCLSIGNVPAAMLEKYADHKDGNGILTFYQTKTLNECYVLSAAADVMNQLPVGSLLMAHNLLTFDVPFTVLRMGLLGIPIPPILMKAYLVKERSTWNKTKEWHNLTHFIDTKLLFPDYPSLDLLCHHAKVSSPKDGITGSEVPRAFWQGRYEDIARYCPKDVLALQQVFAWAVKVLGLER